MVEERDMLTNISYNSYNFFKFYHHAKQYVMIETLFIIQRL